MPTVPEKRTFRHTVGSVYKYLRDINNTEAQTFGLIAMASYNCDENNIRKICKNA